MPITAPQPRYLQLARTLIGDIERGRYAVGDLIPTEFALCEQFGASRFTIREAVKRLVELGLVSRQAGVGTRVLAARAPAPYRQVMSGMADLQQYTHDTELEIQDVEMAEIGPDLANALRVPADQRWLRVQGLRRVSDGGSPPICSTDIYIHPAFRAVKSLGGRSTIPVYARLEEQFGVVVAEVQQQIRAVQLDRTTAQRLHALEDAPALWVCRTYRDARGETIEVAMSTHPADRFSYQETFRREPPLSGSLDRAG